MDDSAAVLTERRGRTLVVTLNRPKVKNAANMAMAEGMEAAMATLRDDPELWVGVITGTGGDFCAGGDISENKPVATPEGGSFGFFASPPDKTLIAAIEGVAVGGGLELALVCDLIVAARDARLGLPEVRHSMMALGGGLVRLPRRLPYHVAMDMILTGELRRAEELAGFGLVNRLCEPGAALETALDLAERVCRNGPVAVNHSRHIVQAVDRLPGEAAVLEFQGDEITLEALQTTEDFAEGSRAFLEKRPPVWQNH
ncbi:MAG: short chain enoyl-CoA hydratase [Actinomycetia bacterium]|nr:short chain enoyl-CoA hydratase [Actinomycetes bacterium]